MRSWGFQNGVTCPLWPSKPIHDLRDIDMTCEGHSLITLTLETAEVIEISK
jgi:hypothetical protein